MDRQKDKRLEQNKIRAIKYLRKHNYRNPRRENYNWYKSDSEVINLAKLFNNRYYYGYKDGWQFAKRLLESII